MKFLFIHDMKRFLLHILIGLINASMIWVHWSFVLLVGGGFLYYEHNEDWQLDDSAFIDVQGWIAGVIIGAYIMKGVFGI